MTAVRDELATFADQLERQAEQAAALGNEQLAEDYRARSVLLRTQSRLRFALRACTVCGRRPVAA